MSLGLIFLINIGLITIAATRSLLVKSVAYLHHPKKGKNIRYKAISAQGT